MMNTLIIAMGIVYLMGTIFTWLIDITVVKSSIAYRGWKHGALCLLIWIFSPVYMTIFLVQGIFSLIKSIKKWKQS